MKHEANIKVNPSLNSGQFVNNKLIFFPLCKLRSHKLMKFEQNIFSKDYYRNITPHRHKH